MVNDVLQKEKNDEQYIYEISGRKSKSIDS